MTKNHRPYTCHDIEQVSWIKAGEGGLRWDVLIYVAIAESEKIFLGPNLTGDEPPGSKIVLKKKNGHLEKSKDAQTNAPSFIRLNTHEIVGAAEDI